MKQRILTLLMALVAIVSIKAQTQDNAMYVYRNDGKFNAFLRDDITEITLSTIDTLGYDCGYSNFVVQEFHTKDTVYRIPISAIDSVSFVQPETKYRDNVMILTDEHLPYISAVTDNTITFKSSTPSKLMPKKGTVLASMTTKAPLTQGFAGKVTKEESASGGKKFTCEDVVLEDIFERLVYVGNAKSTNFDAATRAYYEDTGETTRAAETRADGEGSFSIPTLEFSLGGPFSATVNCDVDVHFAIAIGILEYPHLSMSAIQHQSATVTIGTGDALKVGWNHVWWRDAYTYYIPSIPGLGITITPGFFVDLKSGLEFTVGAELKVMKVVQLILDENEQRYTNYETPVRIKPTVTGAVNFEASLGPCAELSIVYISKKVCSIDVAAFLGFYGKGEGSVTWTPGNNSDQTAEYRYLKDSKLETGLWAAGYTGASIATSKLNFFKPYEFKPSDKVPDFAFVVRKPMAEYYLFPEFSRPSITQESGTGFLLPSSTPKRNLVSPLKIGFSLYDTKAKKHVTEIWMEKDYGEEEAWNKANKMTEQLRPANILTDYQVFPMIQYKTRKVYAEPVSNTFQLKADVKTNPASNVKETSVTIGGSAQNVIFEDERYGTSGISGILISNDSKVDANDKNTTYIDAKNTQGKPTFNVNLSGLTPSTTYYYRAFVALKGLDPIYGEIRSFTTGVEQEQSTVGKAIDLGLPSGTLWADHNLGTDKNTGAGQFFAWGEVSSKSSYTAQNSKWYNMSTQQLIKQGVVDEDAILTPDYDAATRMWGEGWMMPTMDDYKELFTNCDLSLGTMNNVWGMQAKGKNGNTIFFPGVGFMDGTSRKDAGNTGIYWTADTDYEGSTSAYAMYIDNTGDLDFIRPNRYYGLPIRPIYYEEENETGSNWVDLGLPSKRLWASCNLGASKPSDGGNRYAWAETSPKTEFTEENYKYAADLHYENWQFIWKFSLFKELYNSSKKRCILTSAYDPCKDGRMPSEADFEELKEFTTQEIVFVDGVKCCKYTGRNKNFIYLPLYFTSNDDEIEYWTTSGPSEELHYASELHFCDAVTYQYDFYRNYSDVYKGNFIRPVK